MGTAYGPDPIRMRFGVGGSPADDLADLGLPVAVEHERLETVGKSLSLERGKGAVIDRT